MVSTELPYVKEWVFNLLLPWFCCILVTILCLGILLFISKLQND